MKKKIKHRLEKKIEKERINLHSISSAIFQLMVCACHLPVCLVFFVRCFSMYFFLLHTSENARSRQFWAQHTLCAREMSLVKTHKRRKLSHSLNNKKFGVFGDATTKTKR